MSARLTKSEWLGMEIPLSPDNQEVVTFLRRAYDDPDAVGQAIPTIVQVHKVEPSEWVDRFVWHKYFKDCRHAVPAVDSKRLKKADMIRLDSVVARATFESVVVDMCRNFSKDPMLQWYNLRHMDSLTLSPNRYVKDYLRATLASYTPVPSDVVPRAVQIFEQNPVFTTYQDLRLREHQRLLYTALKTPAPHLILLQAPTASGKTVSPVATQRRHIFMSLRHIALEYARICVAAGKKIAFAFNCATAADIRLHYAAAINPVIDKRGHMTVDNSNGRNVEVMICDVPSYQIAMTYMVEFNDPATLFLYFDEPTVGAVQAMRDNVLSTVVLSSATLPPMDMLGPMITRYKARFDGTPLEIVTHDTRKTTVLLDDLNQIVLPHHFSREVLRVPQLTQLQRYFDLGEIVRFLMRYPVPFTDAAEIDIAALKRAYLTLLGSLEVWPDVGRTKLYPSTHRVTNEDAHTITGPTIFFTSVPAEVMHRFIEMSSIPLKVVADIQSNLDHNEKLQDSINVLEKDVEDLQRGDEKKMAMGKESRLGKEQKQKILQLQAQFRPVTLPLATQGYVTRVDQDVSEKVMRCAVSTDYKLGILMGIGVLDDVGDDTYRELVKSLADKKALRIIVAKPIFGIGMNYQFNHIYIGSDLSLSVNEAIQLFGRIDREKIQQQSSVRWQGPEIARLFSIDENQDAILMNTFF